MAFVPNKAKESVPDADTTALVEGYVSITPLDGSWTAGGAFENIPSLTRALEALTSRRASGDAR
jgi:hypothetical protein